MKDKLREHVEKTMDLLEGEYVCVPVDTMLAINKSLQEAAKLSPSAHAAREELAKVCKDPKNRFRVELALVPGPVVVLGDTEILE